MNIHDVIAVCECETVCMNASAATVPVREIVSSDLMSDVLVNDREISMLITSLATPQALRTADIVNARSVLIVNGKSITDDMVAMARDLGLTLLRTEKASFTVCGLLYARMQG